MNSLSELLDYLDSNIPNHEIAETLKKLFFIPAFKDLYAGDKMLAIEYMKIVKNLTSGELMVLFTTYKCINDSQELGLFGANAWLKHIADKCELKYPELVEVHEQKLMDLNLLSKRAYPDRSGVSTRNFFRLTDLGYNLCLFIEKYDEISGKGEV